MITQLNGFYNTNDSNQSWKWKQKWSRKRGPNYTPSSPAGGKLETSRLQFCLSKLMDSGDVLCTWGWSHVLVLYLFLSLEILLIKMLSKCKGKRRPLHNRVGPSQLDQLGVTNFQSLITPLILYMFNPK